MNSSTSESWDVIQNYTQFYAAIVAISLNVLLIALILLYSPSELGPYKYLMIYISVFEIHYAIIDVIVSPFAHSYGSTFLVIVNLKKTSIPPWALSILLSVYCGLYGCSMAIFSIHFIYRYFVARGSKLLKTFQSWKILIWFSIPVLIGAVWTVLTYWPCMRRKATDNYVRENIQETFGLQMDEIEYIAPYFYEPGENENENNIFWPSFIGIGINSCIINVSIGCIIFFAFKCYKCLNTLVPKSKVSSRNRRLQTQLFFALVIQTLIPIILMHIPVTVLYFASFLSFDLGSFSGLAPVAIALYPALDPLPTMFIIRSYRSALLDVLTWIPRRLLKPRQQVREDIQLSDTENENRTSLD